MKELAKNRLISKETLYKFMIDNKILPEDFDAVEESNRLKNESFNTGIPTFNM